jgi:hypothetical protein
MSISILNSHILLCNCPAHLTATNPCMWLCHISFRVWSDLFRTPVCVHTRHFFCQYYTVVIQLFSLSRDSVWFIKSRRYSVLMQTLLRESLYTFGSTIHSAWGTVKIKAFIQYGQPTCNYFQQSPWPASEIVSNSLIEKQKRDRHGRSTVYKKGNVLRCIV